jgi:hypothetical protein
MLPSKTHPTGILITALYGSISLAAAVGSTDSFDVLDYVDPLIGTANGGAKTWSRLPLPQQLMCLCQATFSLEQPCHSVSNEPLAIYSVLTGNRNGKGCRRYSR